MRWKQITGDITVVQCVVYYLSHTVTTTTTTRHFVNPRDTALEILLWRLPPTENLKAGTNPYS